jgi:pimeloyl-ACP methyl ester carboxylesterase
MRSSVIHEAGYVEIGGISQWVQIRGDALENPALLFLHGGPGATAIALGAGWRAWEKDFTIVHWDQRGAGRTFKKNGASCGELMTIQQMANDGLQLVDYLCDRLRVRRIILVGHSWGTVLAIRMIRAKPDLFSAYVGVAQVTNTRRNGSLQYRKLIAALQSQGDNQAVRRIEQTGPPPYGADYSKWALLGSLAAKAQRTQHRRQRSPRSYFSAFASRITLAFSTIWATDRRGMMFSWRQIRSNGEYADINLLSTDLNFEVPIFFFSGTHDLNTPIELVEEYLGLLDAPHKELVRFDKRGHFFLFNAPGKFFAELLCRVRPYALKP